MALPVLLQEGPVQTGRGQRSEEDEGPLFEKPEEHEVTRGVLFCFSEHSGVKLNVSKFDDASGLDAYTRATRPVDRNGFCVWCCVQHGKGKQTYKLYRPWRGRHITTRRAVGG